VLVFFLFQSVELCGTIYPYSHVSIYPHGGNGGAGGGAFVVAQRFGMCMFMCMTRVHCTTHNTQNNTPRTAQQHTEANNTHEQLPQH